MVRGTKKDVKRRPLLPLLPTLGCYPVANLCGVSYVWTFLNQKYFVQLYVPTYLVSALHLIFDIKSITCKIN